MGETIMNEHFEENEEEHFEENEEEYSPFDSLPTEIEELILSNLPIQYSCVAAQVCQFWAQILRSPKHYRYIMWKREISGLIEPVCSKQLEVQSLRVIVPQEIFILNDDIYQLCGQMLGDVDSKHMRCLRSLELCENSCHRLEKGAFQYLSQLQGLTNLKLEKNKHLGASDAADISHTKTLKKLEIHDFDRGFGASMFCCLSLLTNLNSLLLTGTTALAIPKSLSHLTVLTKLTLLDVSGTEYNQRNIESFTQFYAFSCLKHLNVAASPCIWDMSLYHFSAMPSLTFLNFERCQKITGEGVSFLAALPSLQGLNLSHCPYIDDNALTLLSMQTGLSYLNVCGCEHITDEGLSCLSHLTLLKTIVKE